MKKERYLNDGFTLAELLIVVAIIAVLVAVSIPIFISQLEKARESTDLANFRAAKAAIITKYLSEKEELELDTSGTYDADKGIFVGNSTEVTSFYGKGTAVPGNTAMADPNGIIDGYYRIKDDDYSDAVIVYVYEPGEDRLFLRWAYPPDDEPVNELQFEVHPNKG